MTHFDEETLTQYAAGALDAGQRTAIAAHLVECSACRTKVDEAAAFLEAKTFAAPISTPHARDTRPDAPGAKAANPTPDKRLLHQGTALGRYMLLERLGAGGMGEVFAAYDPQLDRKVALKLLRGGTLSASEGSARLVREAQAMARLQHPNVVAVHDVGTFDDRLFIAMEFIEGETLGQWTRGNHTWSQVLRMFVQAGSGLAAAHRAGIVHRDFKPDNILIGADGRPRVLDFGLARNASGRAEKVEKPALATNPGVDRVDITREHAPGVLDSLASPITRDGAVMGTPGYMAPEQLSGLPTDARSDQFAFCVALYEALYGRRPFGGATLRAHATEMASQKLPPAPAGSPVPDWVFQALKRGLSPNPGERFENMEALLSALRPKQTKNRNRTLGGVVALAVVAAVGLGFSVWSARRLRVCGGAEKKLAGIWDPQTKIAVKAAFNDTGTTFALDAFRGVESALDAYTQSWVAAEKDSCEAVRIRKTDSEDLYERKTQCLETRLKGLKVLVQLLETPDRDVVSNAVAAAHRLDRVDDCRESLALMTHGSPNDAGAREREDLLRSRLLEARTLLDAGKYSRGVEVAKSAVLGGGSPAGLAEAYLLLGRLQIRASDPKGAEDSFFEAATHAETSGDAALSARAFSRLYAVIGGVDNRFDDAEPWEKLAKASAERRGNDPDLEAELATNTGDVALAEGHPKDAKKEFERALRIRESTLPEGHPELAMTLNNLGVAQSALHEYDEAAHSYERSLELDLRYQGTEHPNTASSMNNLAVIYKKQQRFSEALTLFERALDIRVSTLGPDHLDVASSHIALGHLLERMDRPDQALEHFHAALKIRRNTLGMKNPQVAAIHADLADLFASRLGYREALEEAEAALEIDDAALGASHLTTAAARERVGLLLMKLGQWDKAAVAMNTALEARIDKAGPQSVEVARSYDAMGELMLAQNHPDKALSLYERALTIREHAVGATPNGLSMDLVGIGRCQLALKQADKALGPLERAVALREKAEDVSELAAARFELARALWESSPEAHDRSRALAAQAHDGVGPSLKAELEKWLAAREPAAPVP